MGKGDKMRVLNAILAWCGFRAGRRVGMPTGQDHERLYGADPEPVDIGLGVHHCKSCQRDRAGTEYEMVPIETGGNDGRATFKHGDVFLTLTCGHRLGFTAECWERERQAAVTRRGVQPTRPVPPPPPGPWQRAGNNGPEPVERRPEPTPAPPKAKE